MADNFDWRAAVKQAPETAMASPEASTFDWRAAVADTPQQPAHIPLWDDALEAADETQQAFNAQRTKASVMTPPEMAVTPDSYANLKMGAPIAGAYGVLDNAINFLPGIAQQVAGIPASQRKAVNLQGDFESLTGLDNTKKQYPKAYAQLAGIAELAAPMPNVGRRETLLGEALTQGALGAGIGLASLPGQSLKHGKDVTLPDVLQSTLLGFGLGSVAGGVMHGLGSMLGARATKAGADDVAGQVIDGESNLDIDSVDEDILAALGLVADKPKPNVMATAMQPPKYARNPLDMLTKSQAPKPSKGAIPLHAVVNVSLDKEMKANIAAAEARVAAIRKAQAAELQAKADVNEFAGAAEGLQKAVEAKANSAKQRVAQVRAQFDNAAQAQEMLDTALQHPLSFKKFKDGGITWTAHALSDEKLAEYSQTLAKKAEGTKGAVKSGLLARADAVNSEIARRAGSRKDGQLVTTPEAVTPPAVPTPVTPETVAATPESFTPQQVDEAAPAIDSLLPKRIGTERALEGVPLDELEASGVVTPAVAEMARSVAQKAYVEKRIVLTKKILADAINSKLGRKTTRKAGADTTEGQLSLSREASEEMARQRKGKDVVDSQREEHLRSIVGDGNKNVALRGHIAGQIDINQPVEALQAQVKQLTKQETAVKTEKAILQQQLLPHFSSLRGEAGFVTNVHVDTLPTGEEIRVAIEHVAGHDVKSFSDAGKQNTWNATLDAFKESGQAWLRNPQVITPAQKAQLIAGLTTLGTVLHGTAAHAAGSGLLDATTTWASLGGTPQALVAALLSGINPVGPTVARNILEGGALGRVAIPFSNFFLGRTIRLADNFRNTRDRVAALNKIVEDTERNLLYQLQMTREYFQLSSHLHGVDEEVIATALFELKTGVVSPAAAATGGTKAWKALAPQQRKAVIQMRALQNSMGNRLRKYSEKVKAYQEACVLVTNGQAPISLLHQFEPANRRSKTLHDVRRNAGLVQDLFHSVGYQLQQLNPMGVAEGFLDKGGSQLTANFNTAAFGQKNYAFQLMTIFDQLVLGSSYAGAKNMAEAAADRVANRELGQLLKSFKFVGDRLGDVQQSRINASRHNPDAPMVKVNKAVEAATEGVGKLAPGYDRERVNAEELALAIIYRHYNKNKAQLGNISKQAYAKAILTGKGHPAAVADCWNEIITGLCEVHAVSPFNLSTNILNESPTIAKQVGWFAKQPAREARLAMTYLAKGDWGALFTYYGMKAVIAGRAAVPMEVMSLMQLANPEATQDFGEMLDNFSLYSKVDKAGTMSPKMQWGYTWWLMAGRQTPLQGAGEALVRLYSKYMKQMQDGEFNVSWDDAGSAANAGLAFIPGGKQLPIRPTIGGFNAAREAYFDKPIKGFPKSITSLPSGEPVYNAGQETSVAELFPNATEYDKALYVFRGAFAPGASKFKDNVTKEFQNEEWKKTSDALYEFFANKAAGQ